MSDTVDVSPEAGEAPPQSDKLLGAVGMFFPTIMNLFSASTMIAAKSKARKRKKMQALKTKCKVRLGCDRKK